MITLDSLSEKYFTLRHSLLLLKCSREAHEIAHYYAACCGFLYALQELDVVTSSEEIALCDELNSILESRLIKIEP